MRQLAVVIAIVILFVGGAMYMWMSQSGEILPDLPAATAPRADSEHAPVIAVADTPAAPPVAPAPRTPPAPEMVPVVTDAPQPAATAPVSKVNERNLTGKVIDKSTGQPVVGADVALKLYTYDYADAEYRMLQSFGAVTNAAGEYEVRGLRFEKRNMQYASFAVSVYSEGYADIVDAQFELPWQGSSALEPIEMTPAALARAVRGRVLDQHHNPVEGFDVVAAGTVYDYYTATRDQYAGYPAATSDPRGEFAIANLTPGQTSLLVFKDNIVRGAGWFQIGESEENAQPAELTVMIGGSVSGRVVDAEQKPVSGYPVQIGCARVQSGADGAFTLHNVGDGPVYNIHSVGNRDYGSAHRQDFRDGDELIVERKDLFRFLVTSSDAGIEPEDVGIEPNYVMDGKPMGWTPYQVMPEFVDGEYRVRVTRTFEMNWHRGETKTAELSGFLLTATGHHPRELALNEISADGPAKVTLEAGHVVRGRVIDQASGEPVKAAHVRFRETVKPGAARHGFVRATHSGEAVMTVTSGDGEMIFMDDEMSWSGGKQTLDAGMTDDKGEFAIRTILDVADITVQHDHFASKRMTGVSVGGVSHIGDIVIDGGGKIQGRLTRWNGQAAAGQTLQLYGGKEQVRRVATADGDGNYVFDHLPAGAYNIFWSMEDGNPRQLFTVTLAGSQTLVQDAALPRLVKVSGAWDMPAYQYDQQTGEYCYYYANFTRTLPGGGSQSESMDTQTSGTVTTYQATLEPGEYVIDIRCSKGGKNQNKDETVATVPIVIPAADTFEHTIVYHP